MNQHTTDAPVKVGIVGAGALGTTIGRQFLPTGRGAVTAIADVAATPRDEAGDELGVSSDARYADYETMLADAALDAVVVATPHALHYEQVVAALDRGLDVLCEKPLVLDLDRAKELRDRVARTDRVVMVGYQRHLDASFRRARDRYAGGEHTVDFVTASITQSWLERFAGTWRTDPELSGGGFLCDTGRHVVDAVLWVTGLDPVAVESTMAFESPSVDTRVDLHVEFATGATASLALYGDAAGVRETHTYWDDDGAVEITGANWSGRDLTLFEPNGDEYVPYLDRGAERNKAEPFLDAVLAGDDPPATPDDAVRATAVVEAAYEAAKTGERVGVDLD